MSAEKKRPTDEDLLAELGALGDEVAKKPPQTGPSQQSEADLLAELGLPERPKPTSRPHTPRLQSNSTTPAPRASPKRAGFATPTSNDGTRISEEKAPLRKSAESSRSLLNITTPATETDIELEPEKQQSSAPAPAPAKEQSSGGGWWGGIFATASAAVKQAEALAKEIQHNEEAQRWAEQVKGNVGALRGFGMPYALSRFTPVLTAIQEENSAPVPCQHLLTFFTPLLLPYPHMNVYKSTPLTTLSATLLSTL